MVRGMIKRIMKEGAKKNFMGRLNIALLAGGSSGERQVSLKSGESVCRALDKGKYEIKRYDPRDDLMTLIEDRKKIDLAFVLLHGRYGEDGCVQGLLDLLGIPFVGSGVLASAVAMNKRIAKEMYKSAGLRVVDHVCIQRGQRISVDAIRRRLGPSAVVKPVSEGSSLGVSICRSKDELLRGIETALRLDEEVLIERYLQGREVTCCVIGNRQLEALPLIEIVPNPEYAFFDYEAKYTAGATNEICPAHTTKKETEKAQSCAKKAHRVLQCKVWSRTDMIIHDGEVYILETNTIPGMTETSLVPRAARAAGLTFAQFLDKLIALSLEEK
jgi:D-alanine-D-alanine ligase